MQWNRIYSLTLTPYPMKILIEMELNQLKECLEYEDAYGSGGDKLSLAFREGRYSHDKVNCTCKNWTVKQQKEFKKKDMIDGRYFQHRMAFEENGRPTFVKVLEIKP